LTVLTGLHVAKGCNLPPADIKISRMDESR